MVAVLTLMMMMMMMILEQRQETPVLDLELFLFGDCMIPGRVESCRDPSYIFFLQHAHHLRHNMSHGTSSLTYDLNDSLP